MKLEIYNAKKAKLFIHPHRTGAIILSKSLEGYRRWGVQNKVHHLKLEPTRHNLDLVKEYVPTVEVVRFREGEERRPGISRSQYSPKTTPRPYQAEAVAKALDARKGSRGFCIWCDPGTGKSKIAIDFMGTLYGRGQVDEVLVIAPKGVHRQWAEDQIPAHCGIPGWSTHWWLGGTRKVPWESWGEGGGIVWRCINYDALNTVKGKLELDRALSGEGKRFGLVIDESHFVKNYRTKRWKATNLLGNKQGCMARMLLSGTPISKNLEDEWAQLKIADEDILGIRYVTHFRNSYCIMGGYNGKEFLGPRNLKRYQEKTRPFIFRATKDQLDGLPEKVYQRWHFSMTPRQRETYQTMKKELIVELKAEGAVAVAPHIISSLIKLQQISNGFIQPSLTPEDVRRGVDSLKPIRLMKPGDNPRLSALKELVKEIGPETPIIVWCRFRWDVEAILKAFGDRARGLYGALAGEVRVNNMEEWLDGRAQILVATPGTGGTGFNLQVGGCNHAIYYSNSEHYTMRVQSEDRIHRIGATGKQTFYWDLVARGSRDMAILANLRRKKSLSDLVLDDIIRELEGNSTMEALTTVSSIDSQMQSLLEK